MFLLPVALVYNYEGSSVGDLRAFIGILIFIGILSLAIIYAWKKGVFKWEPRKFNPR